MPAEHQNKLTVITPSRNCRDTINACLDSVACQSWPHIEHIVIDGESTDGTLELLQSRPELRLKIVRTPANGVYDAMNHGLIEATGDWILFLGGNDQLSNENAIRQIFDSLPVQSDPDLILLSAKYSDGRKATSQLNKGIIFRNSIHHQGCLYRANLFKQRKFDPRYRVYGDYEFNLYLFRRRSPTVSLPILLSVCSPYGLSDRPKLSHYFEEIRARHLHFNLFKALPFDALTLSRYVFKSVKRRLIRV